MDCVYFNVNNGFIEGIIRGYRNGFLTANQYLNLTQCETLEDLKLQLSSTDYGNFLSNISSKTLTTSIITEAASVKLYNEFNYLTNQLSDKNDLKLVEYIKCSYMIDNVALMITGTIHNRDKSEILNRCHPLGWFDTLPTLSVATDLESLYDMVLIDTPLAPYFKDCFSNANDLDDLNIEIVRNKLYKAYLEDFTKFINEQLTEPSKEIMLDFLNFEADRRTINISLNSLQQQHNDEMAIDPDLKRELLPNVGKCYPIVTELLANANDFESVKVALDKVYEYKNILENNNLEDFFYEFEMQLCKDAFTQQFTISTLWAWLKSKEQEIRNITWIAECIAQNQRDKINNYISVY
ncbi:hypothetical protein KAFR_0E04220 [Kazachstania africana CBS 2517]|uniref:V-type proton ATPase subunit n=1 Tax=Kazachstania africana (strain ATCC 22294 / BCRC 22015 / CBS 2517 / CECT 1963 / NBRC 1671 / NRRL Y-8276) TaxID=1071382 RepID=H2AW23_KAZAF|nr:hypothetical protein KAFR_0E04220 [Kazachstania africana CBS 2517]CCF58573.1 hypothetical protein KAFR_0E04220 [Kazachstania africana CBS 2517]